MVEWAKWILGIDSLDGLGTEIGIINSATQVVFFFVVVAVCWLVYRQAGIYNRNVAEMVEHLDTLWSARGTDEERKTRAELEKIEDDKRAALDKKLLLLWKEYEYQKRKDKSDRIELTHDDVRAEVLNQVSKLLEERDK